MTAERGTKAAVKPALVRAVGLSKTFSHRGLFRRRAQVQALKDVSLEIRPQCFTALVGESGSGKSTLANCLALLEKPDSGQIYFEGQQIDSSNARVLNPLRPKMQMVFQDSAGALNPRFSAAEIIAEPLEIQRRASGKALRLRACELMAEVGLSADWADRSPLKFSGGQRQRITIARALAMQPSFLILDESVSGLDLVTQAEIIELLLDLREAHDLTYLLISHDLSLVAQVADYVAVMHHGQIVEQGWKQDVFSHPKHEHTRALMSAALAVEGAFQSAAMVRG